MSPQGQGHLTRKIDRNSVYHLFFLEKIMSRNLDKLKRLHKKLLVRYGPDDAMVLQVKQALESREAIESSHSWWFAPYRERRSGRGTERNRNAVTE